ncbi:MAG: response regulator [Sulfurospirillum sp.]|nr:response regulator [Sulfurospirillum sp.]
MTSKVLIIDDTPEYIDMIDDILDDLDIFAAKDGLRGLELASKVMPHLILLDINMPDMNGYDVCRKLKNDNSLKKIPIIFLSANEGCDFEEIGFNLGAVDYVSKPFNSPVLKARVNTHINLYKLQTDLEKEVQKATSEINDLNNEMTYLAASIAEMKSKETGNHLKRVSNLSFMLARSLNIQISEAQKIKMASILHDIGKVAIPDYILNKIGKFEPQEWEIMKTHAQIGYEMLKESHFALMQLGAKIAHEHHEKYDGTGYPQGLAKDEISLAGRIVAVIDVFDSLLDKRVYKEAWSSKDVREYFIKMRGTHFDPKICDVLLENFDAYVSLRESDFDA